MPSETFQGAQDQLQAAERRQLTALCYDQVGSTKLAALLDPEDARELQRAFHEVCTRVVTRHGGHVDKYTGDGAMVFFGFPRAHEDDPERAVRAGLEIVVECQNLNAQTMGRNVEIAVRVGIATGLVVAGDFAGGQRFDQGEVVGKAPGLAFKLQAAAERNSVLVSAVTQDLTRSFFAFQRAIDVTIGGAAGAEHAWRALHERHPSTRFQALRREALTPLVSREEQLGIIAARWRLAKAGEGQIVLISGEPGIGKSRLAAAVKDSIAGDTHSRFTLQCSPQHMDTALYPVVARLERAITVGTADDPAIRLQRLKRLVAKTKGDIRRSTRFVAHLLSLSGDETSLPDDMPVDVIKEQTLTCLAELVEGLSLRRPLLLIVEDVHWLDPTSQELLDMLVEQAQRLPLLALITFRSEFSPRWLGQPHVTWLALNRLTRRQSATMVGYIAGDRTLPPDTVEQIVSRTDGIPLFVEELTRAVIETRASPIDAAGWPLTTVIPATLADSLTARLDQLGPGKEIVQDGSAIGRTFSFELVNKVNMAGAARVEEALRNLVSLGLANVRGQGNQAVYAFKHALIQESAYQSMLRGRRQTVHRHIAEVLASDYAGTREAAPEILAHHYENGGLVLEAIGALRTAAAIAAERSADKEARRLLERAGRLVQSLAPGEQRDKMELGLAAVLGPVMINLSGSGASDVQELYRRGIALSGGLPRSPEHFPIHWGWWYIAPDFTVMRDRADRLLEFSTSVGSDELELQAHHCQWATLLMLGELRDCRVHIDKGLELYEAADYRLHRTLYGGHDPKVCALGAKALALWLMGFPQEARRSCSLGLAYATDLQHAGSLGHAMDQAAMLYRFLSDVDGVLRQADEMMQFAETYGFRELIARSMIFRGWALAMRGDPTAGIRLMDQSLAEQRAIGTTEDLPAYSEMLAQACAANGDFSRSISLVENALEAATSSGTRYWLAELLRRKGELLIRGSSNSVEEALRCFRTAAEISAAQGADTLLLRALMELVRNEPGREQQKLALAWLGRVCERHSADQHSPDLVAARCLWQTGGCERAV